MDSNSIFLLFFKVLAVILLVSLNGFFVAAEFAMVKVRETQLDALILHGNRKARIGRHILENLNAYLSAAQLGITLASLGLGWIGEPVFTALLSPVLTWLGIESAVIRHYISFIVGFSAITFLHISAGEQAPKAFAIQHPLNSALFIASPLKWFYQISYPFIWILNHSSLWMLKQIGVAPAGEGEHGHSDEELRLILSDTRYSGGARGLGRNLVLNAIDLRHRIVRDIMRPRHEIVSLSTQATMDECIEIAERTRFSRFPLCDKGDMDRTLGIVHIKDLYAMRSKAKSGADLAGVARKLAYVPEIARLDKLMQRLLDRKIHLAIVIDEYGGTMGLITLENILEEVVGQIQDEFDQEKPMFELIDDRSWIISGALPLRQLEELTGQTLPDEGISTTSGLVTLRLGGFPKEQDVIMIGDFRLQVEVVDGSRVEKLKLTRPEIPTVSNDDQPGETGEH